MRAVVRVSGVVLAVLQLVTAGFTSDKPSQPRAYSIPIIDLADETHRQVVVDQEPGECLGHPTTEILEDCKTMIAVTPKRLGRGEIVAFLLISPSMSKSA